MQLTTYIKADEFLADARPNLETRDSANSLMLGICGQLVSQPHLYPASACLKTVRDRRSLVWAAVMTPPHNLVVYAHQGDWVAGAMILAENLLAEGWEIPGLLGLDEAADVFAYAYARVSGGRFRLKMRQRLYELRQVLSPPPERGMLRQATLADIDLAARWNYAFMKEIFGEADREGSIKRARLRIESRDIYLWEDGEPVSIAMKTRPTRKGISIGLVYTPPELRQRGYASACVGELSRLLLKQGWEYCALFTDLGNPTSNHIYQEIGYRPVCDYDEYSFEPGG